MATPSRLQEIMMHFERHCEEKMTFSSEPAPSHLIAIKQPLMKLSMPLLLYGRLCQGGGCPYRLEFRHKLL